MLTVDFLTLLLTAPVGPPGFTLDSVKVASGPLGPERLGLECIAGEQVWLR
jgi:hypothetical protein